VASANAASALILSGLANNTSYQYQIRSRCQISPVLFSSYGPVNLFHIGNVEELVVQNSGFQTTDVTVYPNPTDGFLFLGNLPENTTSASVIDIRGAQIMEVNLQDVENGIDVFDLIDGTYYMVVRTAEGNRITVPFVKSGR